MLLNMYPQHSPVRGGHFLYLFHLILDYICYGISLLILKLREQYDTRELVVHDCYFRSWVNEMR
jgi:hypothetical protein